MSNKEKFTLKDYLVWLYFIIMLFGLTITFLERIHGNIGSLV